MTTNKIVIVPDVHGRTFWRSVLKNKSDIIVFLGDYCDPYPQEKITDVDALRELRDIVEFKKANKNRVILLYGNHDLGQGDTVFPKCRCGTPMTQRKFNEYFVNQKELFQITWQCKQNDIDYLFTHAALTQRWIDQNDETLSKYLFYKESSWADRLGVLFDHHPKLFAQPGRSRGGYEPSGSPVWADVEDRIWGKGVGVFNIFAHNRSQRPYIDYEKQFAMLDCQKIFILEDNKIMEYNDTHVNI
jgi:predicted phosphodiesterase